MGASFPRRSFLGGGLTGVVGLALGCGTPQGRTTVSSMATLTSTTPFTIAHRGGGDNWPEMTEYAYSKAAGRPGLQAIEVSVCLSSDGVLVCSHDANTLRVTGVDLTIGEVPWSSIRALMVTSAFTTDPTQPARPISRFDDVITAHIDSLVAFVEPKTPAAVAPLMATLVALGQPERIVWKQPVNQQHFDEAKSHGFGTWGYVLDEPGHLGDNLARFSASPVIDMLGAPVSKTDGFVSTIVEAAHANGKKTIMWPIRDDADKNRALRLGCEGLMSSNLLDVT